MIILLFILFCSLLLMAVFAYFKRYNYSANIIVVCIMVLSLWGGGWFMTKTSFKLIPYFVYGYKKTVQDDIKVLNIQQRGIHFSNGESVASSKYLSITIYEMVSFIFAAGLVMLAARYTALFLTKRFSIQLYDCLLKDWLSRRN